MKTSIRKLKQLINEAIQHKPLGEAEEPPREGSSEYDDVIDEGLRNRVRANLSEIKLDDSSSPSTFALDDATDDVIMGFMEVLEKVGMKLLNREYEQDVVKSDSWESEVVEPEDDDDPYHGGGPGR